ncbi:uncharacterized protein LOC131252011 [Magnolia sinica]|uniref:uncharacterized protein LOC131252011 n=1 Tax=Magnolia sinica TaxID=86752 RepID=UPI002657DD4F|nr:uncharacterized protein LOC131252011 [Magnolia sinica]
MDGSARSNLGLSGGGGACRNENGNLIFAFSIGYGAGSNNQAELRAIHDDIAMCLEKRLSKIEVESDSKVMVDLLLGKSNIAWSWRPWVSRILNLVSRGTSFKLIKREGNGPANGLACDGSKRQSFSLYNHMSDLPTEVRGMIFLERVGLGCLIKTFSSHSYAILLALLGNSL